MPFSIEIEELIRDQEKPREALPGLLRGVGFGNSRSDEFGVHGGNVLLRTLKLSRLGLPAIGAVISPGDTGGNLFRLREYQIRETCADFLEIRAVEEIKSLQRDCCRGPFFDAAVGIGTVKE